LGHEASARRPDGAIRAQTATGELAAPRNGAGAPPEFPAEREAGEPRARLTGEILVLTHFHERDPQVVSLARDAEDLESLVHDCLAIGARALSAARTTTDVAVIDKAFGEMSAAFSRAIEGFTGDLDQRTAALLDDENGSLPTTLAEFRTEIGQLLDGTFDPTSKASALAKLEEVMRRSATEQVKAVRALIDPDNDESPIARYQRQLVKTVERETARVQKAVEDLKTQLVADEVRSEMHQRSTQKGFTFEDAIEHTLVGICAPVGDIAERVGGTPGAFGKKGDFRVVLNPDDAAGQEVAFTLEAKNSAFRLRDILKEIDGCIANRGALAGIAVFAKDEQCPGGAPFQIYGNRALVVFDPDSKNDLALRLACAWARWVVRRQLAAPTDVVDIERVGSLIDAARAALRTQATIDRALTTSANKITEARGHVASLVTDVESSLASIEGELAG